MKGQNDNIAPGALTREDIDACFKEFKAKIGGGLAQWLASQTTDQGVSGSRPGRVAIRCGLEQVTFTPCLVLVKPRKPWMYD